MSQVAVVKLQDTEEIFDAVKAAIDLIGDLKINAGSSVVIKPNLCTLKPAESGATTDPRIVEAIIEVVRQEAEDCLITVVESDNWERRANEAFEKLGYGEMAKKRRVRLVNLTTDRRLTLEIQNGKVLRTLEVPETLLHMDYFISVAKLKTCVDTKMTGVLKNQYGCIPRRFKSHFHPFLSKILTDLNTVFRPDLSLIDGVVAMEGFGPTEGKPKPMDLIICGKDPLAIDSVAARLMGFNPRKVPHLAYAHRQGLGEINNLQILGSPVEDVMSKFEFIPNRFFLLSRLVFWFQALATYAINFDECVLKVRSALCTVGLPYVKERISYARIFHEVKERTFKVNA